jgi:Leucine rich repeat
MTGVFCVDGGSGDVAAPRVAGGTDRFVAAKPHADTARPAEEAVAVSAAVQASALAAAQAEAMRIVNEVPHLKALFDEPHVLSRIKHFASLANCLHVLNLGFCGLDMKSFDSIATAVVSACDDVSELSIENNKLVDLPPKFSALACKLPLESVVLQSNLLSKVPDVVLEWSRLETLNLSNNKLERVPLALSRLSNLETLELSRNMLTELPEPGFGGMRKLQILKLDHNKLKCLPNDFGNGNSALTVLDISNNPTFCVGMPASARKLAGQVEDLFIEETGLRLALHERNRKWNVTTAAMIRLISGRTISEIIAALDKEKDDSERARAEEKIRKREQHAAAAKKRVDAQAAKKAATNFVAGGSLVPEVQDVDADGGNGRGSDGKTDSCASADARSDEGDGSVSAERVLVGEEVDIHDKCRESSPSSSAAAVAAAAVIDGEYNSCSDKDGVNVKDVGSDLDMVDDVIEEEGVLGPNDDLLDISLEVNATRGDDVMLGMAVGELCPEKNRTSNLLRMSQVQMYNANDLK